MREHLLTLFLRQLGNVLAAGRFLHGVTHLLGVFRRQVAHHAAHTACASTALTNTATAGAGERSAAVAAARGLEHHAGRSTATAALLLAAAATHAAHAAAGRHHHGSAGRDRHDMLLAIGFRRGEDLGNLVRLGAERAQQFLHVDVEDDIELLGGVERERVGARRTAQRLDGRLQLLFRKRIERHFRFLALFQVGAIEFADLGDDFHLGKVEDVRDGNAGLDLVAFADVRHLRAGEHEARTILTHRDQSADRREQFHLHQARTFASHFEVALVTLLAQHREFRLRLFLPALDVALELFQPAAGFFERQLVLLRVDRRDQLIALDFEFRAADAIARLQQFHLVLIVADRQIRLRLLDLFVDLVEFELLFFDARLHFRIVELAREILLTRERAKGREASHLHSAEQVRGRQRRRTDGAQFATGKALDDHVTLADLRGRNSGFFLRQALEGDVSRVGSASENREYQ